MNPVTDMPVALLEALNVPTELINQTVKLVLTCEVNCVPTLEIEARVLDPDERRFESIRHMFSLDPMPDGFKVVDRPEKPCTTCGQPITDWGHFAVDDDGQYHHFGCHAREPM